MKSLAWMMQTQYVQHTSPWISLSTQLNPTLREQDLKTCAIDLVRLILFHEQSRMPFRCNEISKKVVGSQHGAFKAVFEEAQNILHVTFGMELVELPMCAATLDAAGDGRGRGKAQKKAATQNSGEGEDNAGGWQAVIGLGKKGTIP
jgi:hypothetical protein